MQRNRTDGGDSRSAPIASIDLAAFPRLSCRRIYLHAGAVKTGTSALQAVCAARRERLLELGLWYPQLPGDHPEKHQWLIRSFLGGDRPHFLGCLQTLEATCPNRADAILMSSEGLSFHWSRFSSSGHALLDELIAAFRPTCIYVTREHEALLRSCYKQCIANPRVPGVWEFATGDPFDAWRQRGDIERRLQSDWMIGQYRYRFGADRVSTVEYGPSAVTKILEIALGRPLTPGDFVPPKENLSLDDAEAELVRMLNAHGLEDRERERLVAHLKSGAAISPGSAEAAAITTRLGALSDAHVQRSTGFAPSAEAVRSLRERLAAELAVASSPAGDRMTP